MTVVEELPLLEQYSIAYAEHEPINITSDADFIARAALEGWPGNGSEANPYLIDGYNITYKGYKIRIVNVTVHFGIRDCYLASNSSGVLTDPSDDGICLINVSHATVNSNEIVNNEDCGVYVESSHIYGYGNRLFGNYRGIIFKNVSEWDFYSCDIVDSIEISFWILNCTDFHFRQYYVSSKTGQGILIQDSSDFTVRYIDIDNCSLEIRNSSTCEMYLNGFYNRSKIVIDGCSGISVRRNQIIAPSDYGILVSRSNHIFVSQNTIDSSALAGIASIDSVTCNYTANYIWHCRNGILINNETSSFFTYNYIFNQTEYGIRIDDGSDNWIYNNLITSEGVGFFLDDGSGNHWDDGVFLGNFMGGIEDGVYQIDGSAGSVDHFARQVNPVPVEEPLICSEPIIMKTSEAEGILAYVVWLRDHTSNYCYWIDSYSLSVNGENGVSAEWHGPCTIKIDISNLSPGIYECSLDLWVGYCGYLAGEIHLSSISFYYPGYYSSVDGDSDGMFDEWEVAHSLDPMIDDSIWDPDSDYLSNFNEFRIGTDPQNPDSDFDLMPDGWEFWGGFDPLFDDSNEDPDSDDLVNLDEYLHGTDPRNSDSDDDSITDGWEVMYGLDPLDSSDALLDLDSDTLTNLQEFELGTDPSSLDSDLDSLPDAWELRNGFDPLNPFVTPYEYMLFYSPFINSAYMTLIAIAVVILVMDRRQKRFYERLASD
ncbi:MAG: right-handed parallel beta-helix repeat-containing protein [Candidatus Thorarchaeota archaeon]